MRYRFFWIAPIRQGRRQHEAVIVGVGHYQCAHQAGRYAPRGSPDILELALLVGELHVECLCEVLAEEVRGTCLQRLAVLHHRLNRIGVEGACEALVLGLVAHYHRHCHEFAGEFGIYAHHLACLGYGLLAGGVSRVALLPEELGGAQEETRTHLPAYDIRPLVAQQGKVPPGLDPILIGIPDNGLRCRADDEFFLQFRVGIDHHALAVGRHLQAVMGDYRALLRKTFDVLRLAAEERFRNEKREIGIDVPRLLEHPVKLLLHLLPDCISVGLDHHTSPNGGLFRQIRFHYEVVVPAGIIFLAVDDLFVVDLFSHIIFGINVVNYSSNIVYLHLRQIRNKRQNYKNN